LTTRKVPKCWKRQWSFEGAAYERQALSVCSGVPGIDGCAPVLLRNDEPSGGTSASLLISEGAHPRQVMEQLGHSSIAVTMDVYAKVFPSDMDALADRLEERHRSQNG